MRKKFKHLIQIFLAVVLLICLVNFVVKRVDIAETEAESERIREQIRQQELKNGELEDILSEENIDDFYRNLAEDNLGYGSADEKVYQNISGY